MAAGEVLDTAALIAWPLERMRGSLVAPGQRAELARISPDREILLDAAGLEWATPGPDAVAQASDIAVSTGDIVKKGQVIGTMGSSGRSTGPHVHFEVLKNGRHVDPKAYVARR